VAVAADAPAERVKALERAGASLLRLPVHEDRVEPGALLGALQAREVRGVLVEGGGEVHASFLEAGLVDRVALFIAPRLLGGRQATPVVGGRGLALKDATRLGRLNVRYVGEDLLIEADVLRAGAMSGPSTD
jgi:diaminohydroxyphosphoribosylaminopyrimidine deaminase/5-amino-6-(5-phosphoribosylamino)uracil reductase